MRRRSVELQEIVNKLRELEDHAVDSGREPFQNVVEAVGSMVLSACRSAGDFMEMAMKWGKDSPQLSTSEGD